MKISTEMVLVLQNQPSAAAINHKDMSATITTVMIRIRNQQHQQPMQIVMELKAGKTVMIPIPMSVHNPMMRTVMEYPQPTTVMTMMPRWDSTSFETMMEMDSEAAKGYMSVI